MAPSVLISICSQSLNLMDPFVSFPTSLPDCTAERIDICTKITSSIKALGYRGDLSFHQFLYLSSVDAYNLVRFLVEKLSRSSGSIKLDGERVIISRSKKNESCSDVVEDPLRGWTKGTDKHEVDQTGQTAPVKSSSLRIGPLENACGERVASGSSEALAAPIKKDLSPDSCPVRPIHGLFPNEQLEQRMLQSCEEGHTLSAEECIQQKEKLLEEVEETQVQVPISRIHENQKDDIFVRQNGKSVFLPEKSIMVSSLQACCCFFILASEEVRCDVETFFKFDIL
ncbi:Coiled-coil domain-containing protein [Nymphaea thermarum]|nr:Coiled-coil domain-containing protein [Nymphaea thermarum]